MKQRRKRVLRIFIMLFFLCLLLCEVTYYEYESGRIVQADHQTEAQVKSPDAVLILAEQFQPAQTLNSRAILTYIEKNMPERVRLGAMFLFLILFASFVIEREKREQEQSLCQFQTFFQNLLNILHRRDGKKDGFFLWSC